MNKRFSIIVVIAALAVTSLAQAAAPAALPQGNYYEHVIRAYIRNNPPRWTLDHDNPINAPRLSISGTVDQYLRDAGL